VKLLWFLDEPNLNVYFLVNMIRRVFKSKVHFYL
jgi:hypothetical protein